MLIVFCFLLLKIGIYTGLPFAADELVLFSVSRDNAEYILSHYGHGSYLFRASFDRASTLSYVTVQNVTKQVKHSVVQRCQFDSPTEVTYIIDGQRVDSLRLEDIQIRIPVLSNRLNQSDVHNKFPDMNEEHFSTFRKAYDDCSGGQLAVPSNLALRKVVIYDISDDQAQNIVESFEEEKHMYLFRKSTKQSQSWVLHVRHPQKPATVIRIPFVPTTTTINKQKEGLRWAQLLYDAKAQAIVSEINASLNAFPFYLGKSLLSLQDIRSSNCIVTDINLDF